MKDNVILLGNSLNLLEDQGKSWEEIVSKCEETFEELEKGMGRTPLVFRMNRFLNSWLRNVEKGSKDKKSNEDEGKKAFNEMCSSIRGIHFNEAHKKLINIIDDCEIITTNYDYAVEECIDKRDVPKKMYKIKSYNNLICKREEAIKNNLTRRIGRVWHIHGEAAQPESIIIDSDGYSKGLAALKTHDGCKETWLHLFLNSSVHIMGMELRYTESLLWYALQKRLNLPTDKRKPVYYYHFVRETDSKECEKYTKKIFDSLITEKSARYASHMGKFLHTYFDNNYDNYIYKSEYVESLLSSYGVNYCKIVVRKVGDKWDYIGAWTSVFEELRSKMSSSRESGTKRFPIFQTSYPSFNIVTSSTPTSINQERCWINIGVDKLEKFAMEGNYQWIFDTNVRGERRVYRGSIMELRDAFKKGVKCIKNGTERYSFYIDYARGILYSTVSTDNELLHLGEVKDGEEYKKFMRRLPKKR